jgi:hypothetical protein
LEIDVSAEMGKGYKIDMGIKTRKSDNDRMKKELEMLYRDEKTIP